MEFTKTTRKVLVKVIDLLEIEASSYEWGSDEADALGDILCELDDLRRS